MANASLTATCLTVSHALLVGAATSVSAGAAGVTAAPVNTSHHGITSRHAQ
jgi:hypothetical protein